MRNFKGNFAVSPLAVNGFVTYTDIIAACGWAADDRRKYGGVNSVSICAVHSGEMGDFYDF